MTDLTQQILIKLTSQLLEDLDEELKEIRKLTGENVSRADYIRKLISNAIYIGKQNMSVKEELEHVQRESILGDFTGFFLKECKKHAQKNKNEFLLYIHYDGGKDFLPLKDMLGRVGSARYVEATALPARVDGALYKALMVDIVDALKKETSLDIQDLDKQKFDDLKIMYNSVECYWRVSWK